MPIVTRAEAYLVDVEVETVRTDAIQAFEKQETLFVELTTDDGQTGRGYSYTIGTGGKAILAMLRDHLIPRLIGHDSRNTEEIWRDLYYSSHATTVGVITSLAIAAIDIAVWDVNCRRTGTPLWRAAGGYRREVPLYDTEGGWLHLTTEELATEAISSLRKGWKGVKIKVGKPSIVEDVARLEAVRAAVGPDFAIMVDANQSMTGAEAIRRAAAFEHVDLSWFEEPLPAEDLSGHSRLSRSTSIPIAVGESLYSVGHFREYLEHGAAQIVQADVARIGGITPWLKAAHLAEAFNVAVSPHFLMELHVSLVAAIPNGQYVEYIPQLRSITLDEISVHDGNAIAPDVPGIGINWDMDAINDRRTA